MAWSFKSKQVRDAEAQLNFEQLDSMFNTGVPLPSYTVATRPTGMSAGTVIFVSDGGAGAVFQGWNGAAWVNLG